jgi:hypothetical protein
MSIGVVADRIVVANLRIETDKGESNAMSMNTGCITDIYL